MPLTSGVADASDASEMPQLSFVVLPYVEGAHEVSRVLLKTIVYTMKHTLTCIVTSTELALQNCVVLSSKFAYVTVSS